MFSSALVARGTTCSLGGVGDRNAAVFVAMLDTPEAGIAFPVDATRTAFGAGVTRLLPQRIFGTTRRDAEGRRETKNQFQ